MRHAKFRPTSFQQVTCWHDYCSAFPSLPSRQGWDGELLLPTIEYNRRRPEKTVLYQVVQRHYPTLVRICEQEGRPLPDFVVQEFEKFLRCGILAHGFARVHCCDCGYDRLVGFSCKRRGFCASCGGAWMAFIASNAFHRLMARVAPSQRRNYKCTDVVGVGWLVVVDRLSF